jgi:excisionase family DNA binding protein
MTGQQVYGHTQAVHMTVAQVAEELNLDRSSVIRLIEIGDIPATDVAPTGSVRKTWRIDEADLRDWLARRRNTPPEVG